MFVQRRLSVLRARPDASGFAITNRVTNAAITDAYTHPDARAHLQPGDETERLKLLL